MTDVGTDDFPTGIVDEKYRRGWEKRVRRRKERAFWSWVNFEAWKAHVDDLLPAQICVSGVFSLSMIVCLLIVYKLCLVIGKIAMAHVKSPENYLAGYQIAYMGWSCSLLAVFYLSGTITSYCEERLIGYGDTFALIEEIPKERIHLMIKSMKNGGVSFDLDSRDDAIRLLKDGTIGKYVRFHS